MQSIRRRRPRPVRPLLLLLSVALLLLLDAALVHAVEVDFLQVSSSPENVVQFVVSRATFGAPLPSKASSSLKLIRGAISSDCSSVQLSADAANGEASAVLVDRGGGCAFVQTALLAQAAGASMLIVRDTVAGAFASAKQTGTRIYDCSLGDGRVSSNASFPLATTSFSKDGKDYLAACTADRRCVSQVCVLTGQQDLSDHSFQVCCFQNSLVRMQAAVSMQAQATQVTIPVVFTSLHDASVIQTMLESAKPVYVQPFHQEESPWNLSMLLIWLMGVCIVMGAAYYSSSDERHYSYEKVAHSSLYDDPLETKGYAYISIEDDGKSSRRKESNTRNNEDQVDDEEDSDDEGGDDKIELSSAHAVAFLVGASTMLLLAYYVHVQFALNVLFALGTAGAMIQVVTLPLCSTLLACCGVQNKELPFALGAVIAALVSVFWFIERSNPLIWPLQDFLCMLLCFVAIEAIQLPGLRVATTLLCIAFVYDVFFVYISPVIFGSNVMVTVASGGGNVRVEGSEISHETMPMVLRIPLIFSVFGGQALLGLGDLIIPGLLVSFCMRYDYCMGYPLSCNYFCAASISYAVGLLLANVMAVVLEAFVAGQPALMYIVPCMLGTVVTMARCKGEIGSMWHGPVCLRMWLAEEEALYAAETQPLVAKRQ